MAGILNIQLKPTLGDKQINLKKLSILSKNILIKNLI